MSLSEAQVLAELCRKHLSVFVRKAFETVAPGEKYFDGWHIDAICYQLEGVRSGRTRRLLVNQPPRSLKSICTSVAFAAWLLGHSPGKRIIVASYSSELSSELHRQFRMVVDSDWYRYVFPNTRWTRTASGEYITTLGGGRFATSVGGTLTGRGADVIIVDDPLNANEAQSEAARRRVIDWYKGSLTSRLNSKATGAIIVVMQRLHEDDLSGYLLEQPGWAKIILPAIALEDESIQIDEDTFYQRKAGELLQPDRESHEILENTKAEIGSLLFSAQYQQSPVPLEGNLIKREWFLYYDRVPEAPNAKIVQSWDIAQSVGEHNDYSVCTTWKIIKKDYYLLHVHRGRHTFPDLKRKLISLAEEYQVTTLVIEDAGPGAVLLQDLRLDTRLRKLKPIGQKPEGSKADRMAAQSAQIEAGHVHLPKDAPWLPIFLNELLGFPTSRHDDQVDSVSQFLLWQQKYMRYQHIDIGMPVQVF